MTRSIKVAALLGAGAIAIGGLAACETDDLAEPAPVEQNAQAAKPKPKPKPVEQAAPATTRAAKPKPKPTKPAESVSQQSARRSAEAYLNTSAFSRKGLIEQLKFEGYSQADATYAVDRVGANWKEQAAKSARNYLDMSGFSRSGLIEQLVFEGYTREQAEYGVNQVGL